MPPRGSGPGGGARQRGERGAPSATTAPPLSAPDFIQATLRAAAAEASATSEGSEKQPEDAEEPQISLQGLRERVQRFDASTLSNVLVGLSGVLGQLRAWYCAALGLLVLAVVDRASNIQGRLPPASTGERGTDPCLALLRLFEGFLLLVTASHAPADVARTLGKLLQKRRLLAGSVRLEPAVWRLDRCSSMLAEAAVPGETSFRVGRDSDVLQKLVASLRPDEEAQARFQQACKVLEETIAAVFPGRSPLYFGSAVNGFQIQASDIDCVIVLEEGDIMKLAQRYPELSERVQEAEAKDIHVVEVRQRRGVCAIAALVLNDALRLVPDLTDLGLAPKEVIPTARVPILKCESSAGLAVDISFNNTLPIYNSRLLEAYAKFDDRLRDLGLLVKHWAKRRRICNALEGTLSSYSWLLLVIHYLQTIGLAPNLQDKALCGSESHLIDGRHDVEFFDPPDAPARAQCLEASGLLCPDATLEGLFRGFLRYFAYEFPMHSRVVSIRLDASLVDKHKYFSTFVEEDAEEAPAAADEEGDAVDAGEAESDDEEVLMTEPLVNTETCSDADDDHAPEAGDTGDVGNEMGAVSSGEPCPTDGRTDPSSKSHAGAALPQAEYNLQRQLGRRLTLCIDDPMERGRVLGTSFQGAERLVYELRRGCRLLEDGCTEESLEKLLQGEPPETVRELTREVAFEPLIVGHTWRRISLKSSCIGRVVGRGGAHMHELQGISGMLSARIIDPRSQGEDAVLVLNGTEAAIKICEAKVRSFLDDGESAPRRSNAQAGTGRGPAQGRGEETEANWRRGRGHGGDYGGGGGGGGGAASRASQAQRVWRQDDRSSAWWQDEGWSSQQDGSSSRRWTNGSSSAGADGSGGGAKGRGKGSGRGRSRW